MIPVRVIQPPRVISLKEVVHSGTIPPKILTESQVWFRENSPPVANIPELASLEQWMVVPIFKKMSLLAMLDQNKRICDQPIMSAMSHQQFNNEPFYKKRSRECYWILMRTSWVPNTPEKTLDSMQQVVSALHPQARMPTVMEIVMCALMIHEICGYTTFPNQAVRTSDTHRTTKTPIDVRFPTNLATGSISLYAWPAQIMVGDADAKSGSESVGVKSTSIGTTAIIPLPIRE